MDYCLHAWRASSAGDLWATSQPQEEAPGWACHSAGCPFSPGFPRSGSPRDKGLQTEAPQGILAERHDVGRRDRRDPGEGI